MQVTLLGTGCPQVHTRRFGPASLVRQGGLSFLVDCGSGVTQRLVAAGSSGAALDALLLTHLHSDHAGRPLSADRLELASGARSPAADLRPARHAPFRGSDHGALAERARAAHRMGVPAVGRGARARDHRVRGRRLWDADGLRISAFQVDHRPVEPAFGFLFESASGRVAFSGDTTVCDNLVR